MAQVKALIGNIKGKDGIANIYSPSEIEIGTYYDAPLYRKTFYVSDSIKPGEAYAIPNSNIPYSNVIQIQGTYRWGSGKGCSQLSQGADCLVPWISDSGDVMISNNGSTALSKIIVSIDYTK